jgi:D-tyrosyl-tRNA(Tyr) deacylase
VRVVIQRVRSAKLSVDAKPVSQVGEGLVVYFGVAKGDTAEQVDWFAKKIVNMRIFGDENGKMNLSVLDIKGEILAVSQFTLLANCIHGNRPDFFAAEEPQKANELYGHFLEHLQQLGATVKKGVFGADMLIEQLNDGPVTIVLDYKKNDSSALS